MANQLYPSFKEALLSGAVNLTSVDVKAVLIDTADYTFNTAHDFLDDVAAASREETSGNLASKTVTGGVFDAADVTFSATSGDGCEAVILYVDTGNAATSRLIAYIDTASGLPVTLGGDVTVRWHASGIFAL